MLRKLFILAFCVTLSYSESIDQVYEKCGLNVKCAEKKVINIIDEYDTRPTVKILGGFVTIERNDAENSTPKSEDAIGRFMRYLSCHEVKINLPEILRNGRSFISGN